MHRSWERNGRLNWSLVGWLEGWLIDYIAVRVRWWVIDQETALLEAPWRVRTPAARVLALSASGPCGGVRALWPAAACVLVVAGNTGRSGSLVGRSVCGSRDRCRRPRSPVSPINRVSTCTHTHRDARTSGNALSRGQSAQRTPHYKVRFSHPAARLDGRARMPSIGMRVVLHPDHVHGGGHGDGLWIVSPEDDRFSQRCTRARPCHMHMLVVTAQPVHAPRLIRWAPERHRGVPPSQCRRNLPLGQRIYFFISFSHTGAAYQAKRAEHCNRFAAIGEQINMDPQGARRSLLDRSTLQTPNSRYDGDEWMKQPAVEFEARTYLRR
jgi:hypothetical protein